MLPLVQETKIVTEQVKIQQDLNGQQVMEIEGIDTYCLCLHRKFYVISLRMYESIYVKFHNWVRNH